MFTGVEQAIAEFLVAIGVGGLSPVIVQILKRVGVVKDGYGGTAASLVNVLLFVVLMLASVFGVDLEGDTAQQTFEVLAQVANLVMMVLTSYFGFNKLREADVVGFRKR